jgi:hypothetical protein
LAITISITVWNGAPRPQKSHTARGHIEPWASTSARQLARHSSSVAASLSRRGTVAQ